MNTEKEIWRRISRALKNYDAPAALTLLKLLLPSPQAGRALLELIRTEPTWPKPLTEGVTISPAEMGVLSCAARGEGAKETAISLCKGVQTVMSQRKSIMKKLDVHNMTGAVAAAMRHGLIADPLET